MSAPLISLQGLSKSFHGNDVVKFIDLTIDKGEFYGILGPSGCGKTTLLKMIAGLEEPSAGRVIIDGHDMSAVPASRRPVNTVFQSYAIFPHMSLEDNISYGLKLKGIGSGELKISEMIRVGIWMNIISILVLLLLMYFVVPIIFGISVTPFSTTF